MCRLIANARRRGDRIDCLPCCDCSQPLLAQSGLSEMSARLSAFGGEADIHDRWLRPPRSSWMTRADLDHGAQWIEIPQLSGLPYRDVLSLKSEAQGLLPFGRSPTQCLPRYEGERHDADLLHIAVGSWPRLREWSGVGTGLADQTDPSDCRLFRRGHRRRYGACGLRSALDPAPSAGGR